MAKLSGLSALILLVAIAHANPEYARENNIQGIWTYSSKDQLPEDCRKLESISPEAIFERLGRPSSPTDVSVLGGVYGLQIEATHLIAHSQGKLYEYYICEVTEWRLTSTSMSSHTVVLGD